MTSRFTLQTIGVRICLVLCFLALASPKSWAQRFRWPEEPKNLKVLPEDVKGDRLGEIMRGFSSALDVRCEHCHMGEGPDLSKFDFASDEKPTKQKARLMIQMVQAINGNYLSQLTELENPPQERVEVTCITCHRAQAKPLLLENILAETIETDGVGAAIDRYQELRKQFYGGFSFDFSPRTLTGLGERLAAQENYEAALKILQLEIEANGEAASVYFTLGGVQSRAGMREEAIKTYEKGLALAPENWKPFFQRQIDRLRKE